MRLLAAAALLTMLPLPALAQAPDAEAEAKLADAVKGHTPGPAQRCIPLLRRNRSATIDRLGVVYEVGSTLYVNRFRDGCPQLTWDRILVTQTTTGQLCSGDLARIVTRTPSFEVGSCVFGDFTPYKRVKPSK